MGLTQNIARDTVSQLTLQPAQIVRPAATVRQVIAVLQQHRTGAAIVAGNANGNANTECDTLMSLANAAAVRIVVAPPITNAAPEKVQTASVPHH